jgi:tRNA (cmo5U34)-methyltransferase
MKDREAYVSREPDFSFAHRDEGFDNHIDQSIRGYANLHADVVAMSQYFVEDDKNVVDIGCSTGKTLYEMMKQNNRFAPYAKYTGVEYASGFLDDMDSRLSQIADEELGICRFMNQDIRDFTFEDCTLITSLFTLQFMPPSCRRDVLKKIYHGLDQNGAFIFAEKTVSEDARIQEIMTFQFYDHKRKHFSGTDILEKEVELRHMLKPNTWRELHSLLMTAGFDSKKIQPFWQNHLFVGAIAIK